MFQSFKMFCRLALSRWCGYTVSGLRLSESSYSLLPEEVNQSHNIPCLKIAIVTCQSLLIGIKLGLHEGRFHNHSMSKLEHLHISPSHINITLEEVDKIGICPQQKKTRQQTRAVRVFFFNSTGVMVGSWMFCRQKCSWSVSFWCMLGVGVEVCTKNILNQFVRAKLITAA